MSLLKDIVEDKQSDKDLDFQKRRLKELQIANRKTPTKDREDMIASVKAKIAKLEKNVVIDEAVPSNEKEWDDAELKAWKERFPKAKSKTTKEFRAEFPDHQYRRQDDVVSIKLFKESLLKELSVVNKPNNVQGDLKSSDKTDAGANDVADKARSSDDVSFSLMRNTINANGNVSGSEVADYIERAEELNDEVDTVPFGLETDDGQIVKVYVNAEQADKFEEAMKNMLGLEDDIEEAINRLTTEFDIVDVVWPRSEDGEEQDPDANLEIDDTSNLQLDDDPEDAEDFADDNYDVVAASTEDEEAGEKAAKKDAEEDDDEIAAAAAADSEEDEEADEEGGGSGDDEEEEDPDDDPDGGGSGGAKKKKKKKKKAQPAEPVDDEEEVKEAKDHGADSPSTAAAIKKMTSQGLHIKAMAEGPNNTVYIEDDKGDEYVMRGDKGLTKEKHGKKLMSYKKSKASIEEHEQENTMTIGSRFLSRVMQEAQEDNKDGVKDGFNIPLDSQARALVAKLKLPFAKRLIAFHVMAGVPGRYLNTEDVEGSIASAADMLRKKISVRRAFQTLYDGLANAKGYAPPKEDSVKEAKELDEATDPEKLMKAKDAVKRAKKALADHKKHYDGGTGAREKALQSDIDKAMAKLQKVKEDLDLDDEDVEYILEAKQKRGSFIQKLFETVLVELGLPQSLITTTGPAAVGTGIYRTAELIEQDATLERALRLLATRLGVKQADAAASVQEGRGLTYSKGRAQSVPGEPAKDYNPPSRKRVYVKLDALADGKNTVEYNGNTYKRADKNSEWKIVKESEIKEGKKEDGPVTIQGVKGMKSKAFEKTFKNQAALEKWMEKNGEDVDVHRYSYPKNEGLRFDDEGVLVEGFQWNLSGLKENREGPGYYIVTYDGDYYDGPFDTKQDAQNEIDGEGLDDHKVVKLNKAPPLKEAVDVGNDDFAQAVTGLVSALGIPDDVLQRRRTQIVQSLRAKKATLRNRAQVLTMISRLQDIISKNTVEKGGQQPAPTDESASRWKHLSALQETKAKDVGPILDKIAKATGGSMGAVRAQFVGGSSADHSKYLAKLEKDGFDSGGAWEENAAFFKKLGVTKSEYNQLVRASL